MLQIHAVCFPVGIVSYRLESNRFTYSNDFMTRYDLAVCACNSFAITILIDDVLPAYLVAHLRISLVIFLYTVAFAVYQQFHFIGIGVSGE